VNGHVIAISQAFRDAQNGKLASDIRPLPPITTLLQIWKFYINMMWMNHCSNKERGKNVLTKFSIKRNMMMTLMHNH